MARHQLTFRQLDVERAIRATTAATGTKPVRIEIDKAGKISVFLGDAAPANSNEWEVK